MSPDKVQKLCELFKTLPAIDRQLIALKSICCQYTKGYHGYERKFIDAIIKSGIRDERGHVLTMPVYMARIKRLKQLKLTTSSSELIIVPELHHPLLALMQPSEMVWVSSLVDVFYPKDLGLVTERDGRNRYSNENPVQIKARLMNAIYTNETAYFSAHASHVDYCYKIMRYLSAIMGEQPVNIEWLRTRAKIIQLFICTALLSDHFCEISPVSNRRDMVTLFCAQTFNEVEHDYLHYYSAIIGFSLGDIGKASAHCAHLKERGSGFCLAVEATLAFFEAKFDVASLLYRKALLALRKHYGARSYYFDNLLGFYYGLCLIYVDKDASQLKTAIQQFHKYADSRGAMPMATSYELLLILLLIEQGNREEAHHALRAFHQAMKGQFIHPLCVAMDSLLLYATDREHFESLYASIYAQAQQCLEHQYRLAGNILYELLVPSEQYGVEAKAFLERSPITLRLLDLAQFKEAWEYSVQALENLLVENPAGPHMLAKGKRLLWLVNPDQQTIEVVEQSVTKSGKWGSGRAVSLAKLKFYHQQEQFNYLSPEDKRVVDCLVEVNSWYHSYSFDTYRAFLALVGHPNIVHAQNRDVAMTLARAEPELYIEENKAGYRLSLSHWLPEKGLIIEPESLNKYRVVDFSFAFVNIGRVLTKKGLSVPATAKDKLLSIIQQAKRDIKIHVDAKDMGIVEKMGDATPCVQLLPIKEGMKATIGVRPAANEGVYCRTGEGKESFMLLSTDENGVETRVRVVRDFKCEQAHLKQLLAQCPHLAHHALGHNEYDMEEPEESLEVLSELQQYAKDNPLTIEWPQGQKFRIKQRLLSEGLSLNIISQANWFEYTGEMTLADGEVLSMQTLLEALATQSHGRFVQLGKGEFMELTHQLQKQLTLLRTLSDGNKINPLGAQVLSDIAARAEKTTFDKGWEAHLKKIRTMKNHFPTVPATLQASLRDYQVEGFQYLSRLTAWGIGACLADDMGLGKTIQTIALLLARAREGAALVIAPTSVCFNWGEELKKFAPTLNPHSLHNSDRDALIEQAGPFDVIITSYGLLQYSESLLTEKHWETIVLDEAQAIKNAHTQRWKKVMKLKGKSRIALSGTPIENHLGELWSIFSFLNPGLLGSLQSFQSKYSTPIESGQTPQSMDKIEALKTLVSPYILRRLKSQVLAELPPKTEQIIYVEQTEEEAVFYEALRRQAEERMAFLVEENNRIAVLAEITRLRQACCDSSLVNESLFIENSKLKLFIQTVKNIIDNGHKALVFSQYVSFLQIVKKHIEDERISYQYLDGSTTPANRKKWVEAFQAGEGDLFLLSLKAGGSGLNLTAADYVIHLDPWWNPSVEDQASDRAHRIGQERPVTIYRFIVRNTIEEKIIQLHERKRHLANELLSGQGMSGKLSNEELMSLIATGEVAKRPKKSKQNNAVSV